MGALGQRGSGWFGRSMLILSLLLAWAEPSWAQPGEVPQNPFAEGGDEEAETAPSEPAESEETTEAASPEGSESSRGGEEASGPSVFSDLDPLAKELAEIMDEIVQLRSALEVLGRQLFSTRVRIAARREGDEVDLEELVVELDGAPVFRGGSEQVGDGEPSELFSGFAAPGPHRLTLRYRVRARADDAFRYERVETYRFVVPKGALTDVLVELEDDSDIADEFPEDGEGAFDVRSSLRVERRPLEEASR